MDKSQLLKIIGSLFVAVILVASYAAYGSSNGSTVSTTSTVSQNGTAYWHGVNTTTVSLTNFSNVFTIQESCINQTVDSAVQNYTYSRVSMLSNQSVEVTELGNEVYINSGNWTARQVYGYVEGALNSSAEACTLFDMDAHITIPAQVRFSTTYIFSSADSSSATVAIPANDRSYSLPITFADNMTNTTTISIVSLLTQNLQIYGNVSVSVV